MFADPTEIEPIAGIGEPLSAATHLVGCGVFLWMGYRLVRRGAGSALRTISLSLFAAACVFQLFASGVYHFLMPGTSGSHILLQIDHAAIFVLIAATFTPVHAVLFRGVWRWGMLAFIWTAAICGVVLGTIFSAHIPTWLNASFYLAFGWTALISGLKLWNRHGFRLITLLLYGGLAYTVGVGLEAVMAFNGNIQVIPGFLGGHELFHLFVLLGMTLHWLFMRRFATGDLPPLRPGLSGRAALPEGAC